MNYIWDAVILALRQGHIRKDISFVASDDFGPYMELAFDDLNKVDFKTGLDIEINPFYRFLEIFYYYFDVNDTEYKELRTTFFDCVIHMLAEFDQKQGYLKCEYYRKFILKDLLDGAFGKDIAEAMLQLSIEDANAVGNALLQLYKTGQSIELFTTIVRKLYKNSIVYKSRDKRQEVLVYLGIKKSKLQKSRIQMIVHLFLPLGYKISLFWEKHFGIIGIEKTMKVDNIVIY